MSARGKKGCFYQLVKVLTQVAYAAVVGVATHNRSVDGMDAVRLITLIALQFALGLYLWLASPMADRLEGLVSGLEAVLSAISLGLRAGSVRLRATTERDSVHWFIAADLVTASVWTMTAALLCALALPIYDWFAACKRYRHKQKKKAARRAERDLKLAVARTPRPPPSHAQTSAATKINAFARGNVSRRRVIRAKGVAAKARAEEERSQVQAQTRIAAVTRGNAGRRHAQHIQKEQLEELSQIEESKAATKMQAQVRGRAERLGLKTKVRSCVVIQARHRGNISRRQTRLEMPERRKRRNEHIVQRLREKWAANRIRSRAMAFAERCRRRVVRMRKERQLSAASKIAATWRAHVARTRFKVMIIRAQSINAKNNLKQALTEMTSATDALDAKRIAAAQRRREKHESMNKAATSITSLARGRIDRRAFKYKAALTKQKRTWAERDAAHLSDSGSDSDE